MDGNHFRLGAFILTAFVVVSCSSVHRVDGWYPVAYDSGNRIEGKVIASTNDFDIISLDTVTSPDVAVIVGKLKSDKIDKWADATEKRIGKRIVFLFKDSVITAPTVNCRIESGSFSINSADKELISEIYSSLRKIK